MKRIALAVAAAAALTACGSTTTTTEADVPGALSDDPDPTDDSETETTSPVDTAAATTAPATTIAPTTVSPETTAPPTIAAATTAPPATPATTTPPPPPTVAPTTALQSAACVGAEINFFTEGRRDEIALYQQTLRDRGYDPGEIDGYFGPNSYDAAITEIQDNGNVDGPEGLFAEAFPDDGAILPGAFQRLGIACP